MGVASAFKIRRRTQGGKRGFDMGVGMWYPGSGFDSDGTLPIALSSDTGKQGSPLLTRKKRLRSGPPTATEGSAIGGRGRGAWPLGSPLEPWSRPEGLFVSRWQADEGKTSDFQLDKRHLSGECGVWMVSGSLDKCICQVLAGPAGGQTTRNRQIVRS